MLLADGDVRPRHLRLEPAGEHTAITPLSGAVVLLNGKPLEARAVVTYKDRIVVGPYELQVSLLTAAWLNKHGK